MKISSVSLPTHTTVKVTLASDGYCCESLLKTKEMHCERVEAESESEDGSVLVSVSGKMPLTMLRRRETLAEGVAKTTGHAGR